MPVAIQVLIREIGICIQVQLFELRNHISSSREQTTLIHLRILEKHTGPGHRANFRSVTKRVDSNRTYKNLFLKRDLSTLKNYKRKKHKKHKSLTKMTL